jgi:MFS family permease
MPISARRRDDGPLPPGYKWLALSNTTLAILLATLDQSITIIAMPAIFRGIKLNPLQSGNSFYLLWMVLGYLIVSSVLIVSLGRLGDIFGRVRIYNLGFVVYTVASVLLTIDWMTGTSGAIYLIIFRMVQGIGGAFLMANSAAIVTDSFPSNQRGMALGINNIVGVSGTFIGLVLGGVLAPLNWRLVFLISVPVGAFGTIWAYLRLRELSRPDRSARIDWPGNITFAVGLVLIMIAITYGIRPWDGHAVAWMSPRVLGLMGAGALSLIVFLIIEARAADPMFRLRLFRIRAFSFGTLSTFLAALARGGLMFMLIIWLQGIWLPLHGIDFVDTPLRAGLYMLPLTFGMLLAGPLSGLLSDRFGARPFSTGGMIAAALSFLLLVLMPINFSYPLFAAVLAFNGIAMGLFSSPNRAAVMNSLPPGARGAGGGMNQTFQNSAQVLSVGVFFSLMIIGLASTLPHAMTSGLEAHGVALVAARRVGATPPVSVLFAAFLGYNPIQTLVGPHVLATLSLHQQAILTGRSFFPALIAPAFHHGLRITFVFSIVACLIAAFASSLRGGAYVDKPSGPGGSTPVPGRRAVVGRRRRRRRRHRYPHQVRRRVRITAVCGGVWTRPGGAGDRVDAALSALPITWLGLEGREDKPQASSATQRCRAGDGALCARWHSAQRLRRQHVNQRHRHHRHRSHRPHGRLASRNPHAADAAQRPATIARPSGRQLNRRRRGELARLHRADHLPPCQWRRWHAGNSRTCRLAAAGLGRRPDLHRDAAPRPDLRERSTGRRQ